VVGGGGGRVWVLGNGLLQGRPHVPVFSLRAQRSTWLMSMLMANFRVAQLKIPTAKYFRRGLTKCDFAGAQTSRPTV